MDNALDIRWIEGTEGHCRALALERAADRTLVAVPVRVFTQGSRTMLSTVLPIRTLLQVLYSVALDRGIAASGKTFNAHNNRPMIPQHVARITHYLLTAIEDDTPFILPPLTLNAKTAVEVYAPKGGTPVTGWAILPSQQSLFITDGQHRFAALQKVNNALSGTDKGNRFLDDGIPIMVTISQNAEQVHQDFADAAKTKPLPPSLVAVFDQRYPENRAVLAIVAQARLFRDRIDATSTTLSINSPYIFLANQVRQFVKASLCGKAAASDDGFQNSASHALGNLASFDEWVASRVAFLDALTELIDDWREIAELPMPRGPEGHVVLKKMREIRDRKPVSLTAAALNALGLLSYHVLPLPDRDALLARLQPLANVDWSRTGPLWKGNIIEEGLVRTQTGPISDAAKSLRTLLGA